MSKHARKLSSSGWGAATHQHLQQTKHIQPCKISPPSMQPRQIPLNVIAINPEYELLAKRRSVDDVSKEGIFVPQGAEISFLREEGIARILLASAAKDESRGASNPPSGWEKGYNCMLPLEMSGSNQCEFCTVIEAIFEVFLKHCLSRGLFLAPYSSLWIIAEADKPSRVVPFNSSFGSLPLPLCRVCEEDVKEIPFA